MRLKVPGRAAENYRAVREPSSLKAPSGHGLAEIPKRQLGPLSWVARRGKVRFFMRWLAADARILDMGCGDGWFQEGCAALGRENVTGIDLYPPADIVGDVHDWAALGLEPHSFDAIVAFEVVEHDDFWEVFHELLKPDGVLIVTTPVPVVDPLLRVLEALRMLQRRSSPHDHLTDVRGVPHFTVAERRIKAFVSQWAVLRPLAVECS